MSLPDWARYIHHDSSELYLSDISPRIGDTIEVQIRVPSEADIRHLLLRSRPDGEWRRIPMAKARASNGFNWWAADLPITMQHNNYCFYFLTESGSFYLNQLGLSPIDSPDWLNFTVLGDYDPPAWVREQVFYHIFPERFANGDPSNDRPDGDATLMGKPAYKREWGEIPEHFFASRNVDFFGGDLQGITQNLDYLQALGVTAIYINPCFDAETNHYYVIRDMNRMSPTLGGDDALLELRQAMTARGMKLILDITPNHIGFNHPWYIAAKADPDCEESAYFYRHPQTGEIEHWLGVPAIVKLNYSSQNLRDKMYRAPESPIRKWLRPPYSLDGWRLDVANMTGNYWRNQNAREIWMEMRESIKGENPDAYMMGEYFQDSSPHLQGDELDASMNYQGFNTPTRRWMGMGDIGASGSFPYTDRNPFPTESLGLQWRQYMAAIPFVIALQQFNQIGSHDISRPLRVAGGDKALVKAGAALLLGFPGTPCIYYADEIGMDGGGDPDNRRCMPWDESEWDKDLLDFHRRAIAIRRESHALQQGGFQLLHASGDLVAFQRRSRQERMIVAAWRGDKGMKAINLDMRLADVPDGGQLTDLLSGSEFSVSGGKLTLADLAHGQALFLRVEA